MASFARNAFPAVQKTIDRDWTFQYLPAEQPDVRIADPKYDDSRWPAVALPHTWSTYETTHDLHPFIKSPSEHDDSYWWYGWGWYRKRFTIDKRYASELVFLEFDGVQKYSKVYLNGVLAGEHKGGYTSFSFDVTKHVRFGGENVLVVQVSNRRDDPYGRIPPMTAGNFDVYGGVYRDVRLVTKNRLHFPFQGAADQEGGTYVTTPEVSEARATVRVRTYVRNDNPDARQCTLSTTIADAEGKVIAQARSTHSVECGKIFEFDQNLPPITKPHLWSPESPYLYHVKSEVCDEGRSGTCPTDAHTSPLGFRWFSWNHEERRLYLNGRKMRLQGINRHQEYPWLGDAMPKWMHRKDLEDIRKNMGLNFQRTAHYPQDPYVYDLCDRLGIMLIEEVPNIKSISFGKDVQRQNIKEMIRRDRNHPSILIWSMGNETDQPADSAWAWEEDKSRIIYLRRGTNGGDHVMLTDQDLPIENLLRCTVRGWYSNDDHATENPKSGQVAGTEEWQHQTDSESEALRNGENVVVWLYADHGADREYRNSPLKHINPKGFTDAYRFPKFAYYLWQANFTEKPMAFIHPNYWRPQCLGQRKDIIVDSNRETVELKVNGTSIGKLHPSRENAHTVTFRNVEIQRGTISIDRLSSVTMASSPAKIVLSVSSKEITADRAGITVVAADIVDSTGVHVYGANPPLTWKISGPGVLAGPALYETDTNKKEAMEGTMYIDAPVANVVRSKAVAGTIRVNVSAPGLAAAEIAIAAVPPANDSVPGITEPRLSDAGRLAVTRDPDFQPVRLKSKAKDFGDNRD